MYRKEFFFTFTDPPNHRLRQSTGCIQIVYNMQVIGRFLFLMAYPILNMKAYTVNISEWTSSY